MQRKFALLLLTIWLIGAIPIAIKHFNKSTSTEVSR
jgi:hypothetical protein